MKYVYAILVALFILLASATVVWADERDQQARGRRVPEVPFALVYPGAAVFVAVGSEKLRSLWRHRKS